MKKIFFLLPLLILTLSLTSNSMANQVTTANQATWMGNSGLIAISSADTIPFKTFLIGGWYGFSDDGFLPRFLISPIPRVELGLAFDVENGHPQDETFMLNGKIKVYDGEVNVALGGNYQFNDKDHYDGDTGQLFFAFTWKGWANTSAIIGKTFGHGQDKNNIDFGIGLEKPIFTGEFGGLAIICDFSNFNYRAYPVKGFGNNDRGIFNAGVRVNLFGSKVAFDFVFVDLLDDDREIVLGASFNHTF